MPSTPAALVAKPAPIKLKYGPASDMVQACAPEILLAPDPPMRLLKIEYIIDLWAAGGKLLPRQNLPDDAFHVGEIASHHTSSSRTRGSLPRSRSGA